MNNITIIGNISTDISERKAGETIVYNFNVAVNHYNTKTKENEVVFLPCAAFGKIGENISKYCAKGHKIGITGEVMYKTGVETKNGKNNYMSIIVNSVDFCSTKRDDEKKKEADKDDGFPF